MIKSFLIGCAVLAAGAVATPAKAHVNVGLSFGFGGCYAPAPVYVAPQPVVVAPAPVYAAPAPVYVAPPPVVYAPAPVVYGPGYYGPSVYIRGGFGPHHHHYYYHHR